MKPLWEKVDRVRLSGQTFAECYGQLAEGLDLEGDYWDTVRRARLTWVDLFENEAASLMTAPKESLTTACSANLMLTFTGLYGGFLDD